MAVGTVHFRCLCVVVVVCVGCPLTTDTLHILKVFVILTSNQKGLPLNYSRIT